MEQTPTIERQPTSEYLQYYEDAATWAAEVLDGSMRTEFEFAFNGEDLVSSDGRALGPIFEKAIIDARRTAAINPTLAFEVDRREIEQEEYFDMLAMVRGELPNIMVVVSDFPSALAAFKTDIGGYNVRRMQTMKRVIAVQQNSSVRITSQSLDGSNRRSLEAIYEVMGYKAEPGELLGQRMHEDMSQDEQDQLSDVLTNVYDDELSEQFGGVWYAGRSPIQRQNTYDFVRDQHDLLDEFARMQFIRTPSDDDFYNFAAAMTRRFEQPEVVYQHTKTELLWYNPAQEMVQAGQKARSAGKTYSGCGLSVGSKESAEEQIDELGYGNSVKEEEDKYGSLKFKCPKGHSNTRPRNKLIERCKTCGTSVKC